MPEGTPFPLLTLGDVLVLGAMTAQTAALAGPATDSSEAKRRIKAWYEEMDAAMRSGKRMDAQWWTEFLVREMEKGQVNAHEMRTAIFQALAIVEKPHRARQAIVRLIKEKLPGAPQGRQTLIGPDQFPVLLRRSDEWLSVSTAIVGLTMGLTSGGRLPLRQLLDSLNRQFPKECARLRESPAVVEGILAHPAVSREVKTLDARARRLADALAGAMFGLSPAYAAKRAQAARAQSKAQRTGA
ncbi:MAG: hypothetical protein ACRD2E_12760 [Terriglobales bacterium]